MNFRKVIAATGVVGALIFTSACSASDPTPEIIPPQTTSAEPTVSAEPTATPVSVKLPDGIIVKGVANDGKGIYLQTSISDDDPAMKYNPAITDDAAKAHFSEAELAEAQKVVVKFIAEESIDSTLNGGNKDIDGWFAAHKNQIHPTNQSIMLADLKAGKDAVAREQWIANKPGYSYLHGDTTPRIQSRTITPKKLSFVEGNGLRGVTVETTAFWSMQVTGGSHTGIQHSTAEISYSVVKDAADGGKWKIAAYQSNYHTAEG